MIVTAPTSAELDARLADLRGQLSSAEAEQAETEQRIATGYASGAEDVGTLAGNVSALVAKQNGLKRAIEIVTDERKKVAHAELTEQFIGYWVAYLGEQDKLDSLRQAVDAAKQALIDAEAAHEQQKRRGAQYRARAEGLASPPPGMVGAPFTAEELNAMPAEAKRRFEAERV